MHFPDLDRLRLLDLACTRAHWPKKTLKSGQWEWTARAALKTLKSGWFLLADLGRVRLVDLGHARVDLGFVFGAKIIQDHIVQLSHLCYLDLKIVILDTEIRNKQSGTVDSALDS